ncbi:MAG TPA: shikimate dehydrogenase [Anaeromyxobacteraceae bacterium]|nr:shikimate dehydrogenase [Anaeromyxobacteraceae bacterium]
MISSKTRLFAVVGWPVEHSLSPVMQNAAFAEAGVDAAYLALPVAPSDLQAALGGAHALGFAGLNVTVPHKEEAARLCETLDPIARKVGAVNTLSRLEAGWAGHNTDAPALRGLLTEAGLGPRSRGLVLGAGGAARAAVWALLEMGAEVTVAARRPEAAAVLCREMALALGRPESAARPSAWDDAAAQAIRADAVVHATSLGLPGKSGELPLLAWRAGQVAVDFVYGDTAFARSAREAGTRLVTGEQLLVRQGALAFRIWLDRHPSEEAMARAVGRHGRSS